MYSATLTNPLPEARPSWCAIVGAPRCGTTSLAKYLGANPGVRFSKLKEPHFFSRRDLRNVPERELPLLVKRDYLDRFFPDAPRGRLLAEASVSYLYAPERLLPAISIWPDAKFVIAVRNPLKMLPSLHLRNVHNGDETVRDFGTAWNLVEERRRGNHIPRSCIDARLLDYAEIGQLGKYVARFLDIVGSGRCIISVFDDLKADPGQEYRRILDFLGLQPDFTTDFHVHRPSARIRLPWLQRLLKRPPKAVLAFFSSDAELNRYGMAASAQQPNMHGAANAVQAVRKYLLDWNRVAAPPRPCDAELQRSIANYLRDDVRLLSAIVGRDLSHWLNSSVPSAVYPAGKQEAGPKCVARRRPFGAAV